MPSLLERGVSLVFKALALGAIASSGLSVSVAQAGGTLFAATDTEEFESTGTSSLFRGITSGPNLLSSITLHPNFPVNGLGEGPPGTLLAGQPQDSGAFAGNTLRTIDYNGSLIFSYTPAIPSICCNEELQIGPNGNIYHAHFTDNIQELRLADGAVLNTFAQPDVVGMTNIDGELWISKWSGHTVGTWDPSTNTYTEKFNTTSIIDANTGALAWDPVDEVLWVGFQGGDVFPLDLAGNQLGDPIQPLGQILDTIDGLAFVPNLVPEPSSYLLLGGGLAMVAFAVARRRKLTQRAESA